MTIAGHRIRPAPRHGDALDRLTDAVPIAALLLLIVNDHVLKPNHPGWLSGKLSDVAVLALLPFLFVAVADLAGILWPRLPAPRRAAVLISVVVAMVLFSAIEVIPIAGDAYRWGLGLAQWPVRAVAALLASTGVPGVLPVRLTFDPSDLLTLPAAATILVLDARPRWIRAPRAGARGRPG
jgi:hypothetical protein